MIYVPSASLSARAETALGRYQAKVDGKPTYKERVQKAKKAFKAANKKNNLTFREVRETLDEMCSGARRCHYCEDSAADEVEHFYPKDLYPGDCFRWPNYLYSCGRCNGTFKNNRFAIFRADTREVLDITPSRHGRSYEEPPPGDPLLIDPRREDPLDFLILDLSTFLYCELPEEGTEAHGRAEYTIELLGLNDRQVLVAGRREAYRNYLGRMDTYRIERERATASERRMMISELQAMSHPTVWQEMKRQFRSYGRLRERFEALPEALEW